MERHNAPTGELYVMPEKKPEVNEEDLKVLQLMNIQNLLMWHCANNYFETSSRHFSAANYTYMYAIAIPPVQTCKDL